MPFFIEGKSFSCPLDPLENNQFSVRSAARSYDVIWDESVSPIEKINHTLAENPQSLLFMDKHIYDLHRKKLQISSDRILTATASETFKTLDGVREVLDFLYRHKITRNDTLIVVGGGIIQGVGGFASACYKLGIRWIYFPTTLVSMCDSCIGGKTGINFHETKNQLALLSRPAEIIIHLGFLKTLPEEAIRSGLGEILKQCIIGGEDFFSLYQKCVKQGRVARFHDYKKLILGALSIKRAIVEEDEFESCHRKSLNYGHTLGHAIEVLSNFSITHGAAVAVGMMLANELSFQHALLTENKKIAINKLCSELIDSKIIDVMRSLSMASLLDLLKQDKKAENNHVSFVMLKEIGDIRFLKLSLDNHLFNSVTEISKEIFS